MVNRRVQSSLAGLRVAVIAPSISTSREARNWLKLRWEEVLPRQVMMRSSCSCAQQSVLPSPQHLRQLTKNFRTTPMDSRNISGPKFHVYVHRVNDDLSVSEFEYRSYRPKTGSRRTCAVRMTPIIDRTDIADAMDGIAGERDGIPYS